MERQEMEMAMDGDLPVEEAERSPSAIPATHPSSPKHEASLVPDRHTAIEALNPLLSQNENAFLTNQAPDLLPEMVLDPPPPPPPSKRASSRPTSSHSTRSSTSSATSATVLGDPQIASDREFIVPISLMSQVRKWYQDIISDNETLFTDFLENTVGDPKGVWAAKVDKVLDTLEKLVNHQDLLGDKPVILSDFTAKFAENCSAKCVFVLELLKRLQTAEKHVAIIARPGRMQDILEAILQHGSFRYTRHDRLSYLETMDATGDLQVTLCSPFVAGKSYNVAPADLVIAFDSAYQTSDPHPAYERLRRGPPRKPLCSVVRLVVPDSVEHIDLCLAKDLNPSERRDFLLKFAMMQAKSVGTIGFVQAHDTPPPDMAANTVAEWFMKELAWPLGPISRFSAPEIRKAMAELRQRDLTGRLDPGLRQPNHLKRTLNVDDTDGQSASKRMRTPTPAVDIAGPSVPRGNGLLSSQGTAMVSDSREMFIKTEALDTQQAEQVEKLLSKVASLEEQLRKKTEAESEAREAVNDLNNRLADYENTVRKMEPLQRDYAEQMRNLTVSRDHARTQLAEQAGSLAQRNGEVAALTEKLEGLEEELAKYRKMVEASAIPEIAELEKSRSTIQSLQEDKESLALKLSRSEADLAYARASYQQGSSSSAELSNQFSALQLEVVGLRRKADENAVRIHEIQAQTDREDRESRMAELERLLEERDAENAVLRSKFNGRREMQRGASPRSPMMSHVASPRAAALSGGGAGKTRSRGNSPAPGENTFVRDTGGGGRWPHHLRDH